MSIERNLAISLLKLSKEGSVLIESVKNDAKIPTASMLKMLGRLQNEGLVYFKQDTINVETDGRLKLAVKAVSLGADVESISRFLCWQEFEAIAALALRNNGYVVQNNVRFKYGGRRWEIDVVGCRKPLVVCVDCKHWQRALSPSALKRTVNAQVERTKALADSLPNIALNLECTKWGKAKFLPAMLSLVPCVFKFYDNVPVVAVLQLQDFLHQLPAYVETLKFFPKSFNPLGHDF
ncbi:MAG: restriction endonuclease [Candidatus Bathyarchaeota archaeon]|nr:restriction endonuclease [Candidatus Bathyarchaeota archaeon]